MEEKNYDRLKELLKNNRNRLERKKCDEHFRQLLTEIGQIEYTLLYDTSECSMIIESASTNYSFAAAGDGFKKFRTIQELKRIFQNNTAEQDLSDEVTIYSMSQIPSYAFRISLSSLLSHFKKITSFILKHAHRHQLFDRIFYLPGSKKWYFEMIPYNEYTFITKGK